MRIFNKLRGTRGIVKSWQDGLHNQESIHRARVLAFWKKHGLLATKEAFGVSRRTLFRWQRASQRGTLVPGNRAPRKRRRRETSPRVCDFIVAERSKHPRLGKEKLQSMLKAQGYAYSVSTVGRIVGDLKKRGRLKQRADMKLNAVSGRLHEYKKPRVRKKHRPQGTDCLELDTVVRFVCGTRRYVITAIDTKTKFAFAGAYAKHSSTTASDLLNRYKDVSPVPIAPVQTDNGSEFSDHFEKACKKLNLTHYHTYPHCPKMNGVVERLTARFPRISSLPTSAYCVTTSPPST